MCGFQEHHVTDGASTAAKHARSPMKLSSNARYSLRDIERNCAIGVLCTCLYEATRKANDAGTAKAAWEKPKRHACVIA